jgi:hypothetical protein
LHTRIPLSLLLLQPLLPVLLLPTAIFSNPISAATVPPTTAASVRHATAASICHATAASICHAHRCTLFFDVLLIVLLLLLVR